MLTIIYIYDHKIKPLNFYDYNFNDMRLMNLELIFFRNYKRNEYSCNLLMFNVKYLIHLILN